MMIRAIAFLCALALPAGAQSFRGLTPGMDISVLETLGEAYGPPDEISDGLFEVYFEYGDDLLFVYYRDGHIVEMVASTSPSLGAEPPVRTASYPATIADAIRIAGSEGWYIEEQGQVRISSFGAHWEMYYHIPDRPGVVLRMQFYRPAPAEAPVVDANGVTALDPDATLNFVALYSDARLAETFAAIGTTRVNRPGAAPFATPLSEAFPSPQTP